MIIKLAIIGVILIAGGILIFPETIDLISNGSNISDSITYNLIDLKDDTVDNVENTIDSTVEQVSSTIDGLNPTGLLAAQGLIQQEQVFYGQVISKDEKNTCEISVPDMAQTINGEKELTHIIIVEDCEFGVDELVQVIKQNTSGSSSNSISSPGTQPAVSIQSTPSSLIFETLSLTTQRDESDDVMLQYEDTSGNTISVTVTLKNTEKELFSGVFFASKFETTVNDVSDTPHIIEMVVEHAEYGMISSSVFNPAGNMDNTISGVFTQA